MHYTMTTTCTHSGCDVISSAAISTSITCHCRDSRFDLNGNKVRGPADTSLTHFAVDVATDGTITVRGGTVVAASIRAPAA